MESIREERQEERYEICKHCGCDNIDINLICVECARPLLSLSWQHFFFLTLLIFILGVIINYKNLLIPSIFVELIFTAYILIVLRKQETKLFVSFLVLIVLPLFFINKHGDFGIQFLIDGRKWLIVVTIICLFSFYFYHWYTASQEIGLNIIGSLTVVYLTFLLLLLLIIETSEKFDYIYRLLPIDITPLITNRTLFINYFFPLFTVIQILFVALVKLTKKKIDRPKAFLNSVTEIESLLLDSSSINSSIIDFPLIFLKTVYNLFLHIYKVISEVIKAVINIVKISLEYIIRYFLNYVLEILKLTRDIIKVFWLTNHRFFSRHAFAVFLFYIIAYQVDSLIENIFHYVNEGKFQFYLFLSLIILVFVEVIIFIWRICGYSFIKSLYSVAASNTWLLFQLFISTLIASWGLWGFSNFLLSSWGKWVLEILPEFVHIPSPHIGYFTQYASILIVIASVVVWVVKFFGKHQ